MPQSATNTYQMKREIIHLCNRLSSNVSKEWQKFTGDMVYGMLASASCILSQITDTLKEPVRKKNTVERLSRKLTEDIPSEIRSNYLSLAQAIAAEQTPIFVDDSDIVKPYGKAFESMGFVRDASLPTPRYEKGYHVTELVALSEKTRQPFSIFSHVHSSHEKGYTSVNSITLEALKQAFIHFPDSTYVFDRGYDMSRLIAFMCQHQKKFIIRLTGKRKAANCN